MNITPVCKQLTTSYNTNKIDILPTQIIDSFRKVVSDIPTNNEKENHILIKLLQNHFQDNKPIAHFISGPRTLTVHKSTKYNKIIYIFGEYHGHDKNCDNKIKPCKENQIYSYVNKKCVSNTSKEGKEIKKHGKHIVNIVEYLSHLFENTDVFIDFYLESHKIYKDDKVIYDYNSSNYTQDLRNKFAESIHHNKRNPDIVRSHFIDLRNPYDPDNVDRVGDLLFIYVMRNHYELTPKRIKRLNRIYKRISTMTYDEYIKFVFDNFNLETEKEVKRSYLGQKISDFFIQKINLYMTLEKYYTVIEEINRYYNKQSINDTELLRETLQNIYRTQHILGPFIVDCYALCRIFKKFRKTGKYEPDEPTNIITYTGNSHSEHYREFLYNIGFEETERAVKNVNKKDYVYLSEKYRKFVHNIGFEDSGKDSLDRRCLNMLNIKQPFFQE